MDDPYPSRTSIRPELIPRTDPVLFGRVPGPLDDSQLASFEADGFLVLDRCLSAEDTESALEETHRAVREAVVPVLHEPDSLVLRSVFSVHAGAGPTLAHICAHPLFVGAARQILGSDVYVHQSRVDLRSLEAREHHWQSDWEIWHVEDGMPRMRAITAAVLLTPATHDNGPLLVIPGSHRTFVPCLDLAQIGGSWRTRHCASAVPPRTALCWLVEDSGIRALLGDAGTVILFDCNLLHASPGSMSPSPGATLSIAFNSVENELVRPFDRRREPRPNHFAQRTGP